MATVTTLSSGSGYLDDSNSYAGGVAPVDGDDVVRTRNFTLMVRNVTNPIIANLTSQETGLSDTGGLVVEEDAVFKFSVSVVMRTGNCKVDLYPGSVIDHTGTNAGVFEWGYLDQSAPLTSYGTQAKKAVFRHTGASGSLTVGGWLGRSNAIRGSYLRYENISASNMYDVIADHIEQDLNCGTFTLTCNVDRPLQINYSTLNCSVFIIAGATLITDVLSRYINNTVITGNLRPQYNCQLDMYNTVIMSQGSQAYDNGGTWSYVFEKQKEWSPRCNKIDRCFLAEENSNAHFLYLQEQLEEISDCLFENFAETGIDAGDCIMHATAFSSYRTINIHGNIVLPNASGESSGVFVSKLNGTNLRFKINNNTFGETGLNCEGANALSGDILEFKNNILQSLKDGMVYFDTLSAAGYGWIVDADFNCYIGSVSDKYGYAAYPDVFQSEPGLNDVEDNLSFAYIDSSRTFASWVRTRLGYTTGTDGDQKVYGVLALQNMNNPTSEYYHANATVVDLVDWVREGWAPISGILSVSGVGGDLPVYIGAVEPIVEVGGNNAAKFERTKRRRRYWFTGV